MAPVFGTNASVPGTACEADDDPVGWSLRRVVDAIRKAQIFKNTTTASIGEQSSSGLRYTLESRPLQRSEGGLPGSLMKTQ